MQSGDVLMVSLQTQGAPALGIGNTPARAPHIYPAFSGMLPEILHLLHARPFPHAFHRPQHARQCGRLHTGQPVGVAFLRTGERDETKQFKHGIIGPHPSPVTVNDDTPQPGIRIAQHFSRPFRAVENILAHTEFRLPPRNKGSPPHTHRDDPRPPGTDVTLRAASSVFHQFQRNDMQTVRHFLRFSQFP